MATIWTQIFPQRPSLTEKNLATQNGKVFIVTGGASGIGLELAKLLYNAGGTVYIAGRSETTARAAIQSIEQSALSLKNQIGRLEYLFLDLADLASIKGSVEDFESRESRLNVLWNNAGVGMAPANTKSVQGIEIQYATNCVGPLLLTYLLLPSLRKAAAASPEGSVRVIWSGSMLVDRAASPGGFEMKELDQPGLDAKRNYTISKVGNWFLANETAKMDEFRQAGILCLVQNPGNLKTSIWRYNSWILTFLLYPILYDAKYGAYTELWAGLSEELKMSDNGKYIIPWGRPHPMPRQDILTAMRSEEQGGTGRAKEFLQWCERKIHPFR